MIVVPISHDFIHMAAIKAARLPPSLLDEVTKERRAWPKRHMIDIAVQGLVHSEHEPSHIASFGGIDVIARCNQFYRSTDLTLQTFLSGFGRRSVTDRR